VKGVPRVLQPVRGQIVGPWKIWAVNSRHDQDNDAFCVDIELVAADRSELSIVHPVVVQVGLRNDRTVFHACVTDRNRDGIKFDASTLRRFAWARWLTIADAAITDLKHPDTRELSDGYFAPDADIAKLVRRQRSRQLRARSPSVRPGRRGHPDSFYKEVAQRYRQLRHQEASIRPTKDLADEYKVNRSTAAGWIKTARARGHLNPGKRGRPGG
jgi:hypothetical protein